MEKFLKGSRYIAFKSKSGKWWLTFPKAFFEKGTLSIGLITLLARPDKEIEKIPGSLKGDVAIPLPAVRLHPVAVGLLSVSLLVVCALLFLKSGKVLPLPPVAVAETLKDVLLFAVGLYGVIFLLEWLKAGILRYFVDGTAPVFGLSRVLIPVSERVAWSLGLPPSAGLLSFLTLLSVSVAALVLGGRWAPALFAGGLTGALFSLLKDTYPLSPGPLTPLKERLFSIEGYWRRLRLSLATRFFPFRTAIDFKGSTAMALLALTLAGWIAGAGGIFYFLSKTPPEGLTPGAAVLRLLILGFMVFYMLWLARQMFTIVSQARALKGGGDIKEVEDATPFERELFKNSALVKHVEELKEVTWRWLSLSPGSVLIKEGARDRNFYWIVEGEAQVIGTDERGDPVHLATLHPPAGVGEIALLKGVERTATVIITEPSVVGALEFEEFEKVRTPEVEEKLEAFVLASQALSSSPVFRDMPPAEREKWVKAGDGQRYAPGEIVVREGDREKWLGVVLEGELIVVKGDETVGKLSRNDVFGEMALLGEGVRTATLKAQTSLLIWRWQEDFLEEMVKDRAFVQNLKQLMKERLEGS